MSTAAKQPCAPPLNLVPNGATGSAFPPPLDPGDFPSSDSNPGFGDLVDQALAGVADPSDGFDLVVSETSGLIDALDSALASQDADLDTILSLLASTDNAPAENALTDYSNTFDTGNTLLGTVQALSVPDMGALTTLWVSSNTNPIPPPPGGGQQVPGQITVGDPPFVYTFKFTVFLINQAVPTGVQLNGANKVITAASLGAVSAPYQKTPGGGTSPQQAVDCTVNVNVDPVAAGLFQASVTFTPVGAIPTVRGLAVQVLAKT